MGLSWVLSGMCGRDERTIPAQPALDGMDHLQPLKQATILQYGLKTKNATIPQSRDPMLSSSRDSTTRVSSGPSRTKKLH